MESKFHHLVEAVQRGHVGLNTGTGPSPRTRKDMYMGNDPSHYTYKDRDFEELRELTAVMSHTPKFCLDPKLLDAFEPNDVVSSLQAMYEAGCADLPFSEVVVEYDDVQGTDVMRTFVLLTTRVKDAPILKELDMEDYPFASMRLRLREFDGKTFLVASPSLFFIGFDPAADAGGGKTGFGVKYATVPAPYVSPSTDREHDAIQRSMLSSQAKDLRLIDMAISYLIVALSTKGAERVTVPAPHKLNKQRAVKGRPPLSEYIVVKIGHVYDDAGNKVTYNPTGRHVRVHSRRAHNKMQPHGAKWIAENPDEAVKPMNTETHHLVHIPSVLVNYKPGAEVYTPKYIVKP